MNTTKIGKFTINYNNSKEFHILKSEIFGNDCYKVELDNDKPYILDVGAYIGLSVIYFKSIYPNSKIVAFEPNLFAREILEENIFVNNLKDVTVLPYAIDSSEGKRDLHIDTSDNNWQSTASFFKNSWNGKYPNDSSISVETKKLSTFLKDKTVDLLKLDIEGLEKNVLEESKEFLTSIKNIIIEYHPIKKQNFKKILSILKESHYKISFYQEGVEVKEPNTKELIIIKAVRI